MTRRHVTMAIHNILQCFTYLALKHTVMRPEALIGLKQAASNDQPSIAAEPVHSARNACCRGEDIT